MKIKNLTVISKKTEVLARITRKRFSLTFNVPVTPDAPEPVKHFFASIHVVYDKGQKPSVPDLRCIVLGNVENAEVEGRVVYPTSEDDLETISSMFNDSLAEHLGQKTCFLVDGDEWEAWFDELCDRIEKKTGVTI